MTKQEANANIGKIVTYTTTSSYGVKTHKCIIKKVNADKSATINCDIDGSKNTCCDWDIQYNRLTIEKEVTK